MAIFLIPVNLQQRYACNVCQGNPEKREMNINQYTYHNLLPIF